MPNFFNCFPQDMGRGVHNLNSDTLKMMLSNVAPSASNSVFSDITDISAGNGYTAGGATVGTTAYSQTAGVGSLTGSTVTFTASGGSIGPFRYVVLYNSTPVSPAKPLIAYLDLGSAVTLGSGGVETITFPSSTILTATKSS